MRQSSKVFFKPFWVLLVSGLRRVVFIFFLLSQKMRSSVSPAVVEAVRAGKRIGFLVGAGISVACGIPDFRSPNGFYATLKADSLTCTPEQLAWIKR